MLATSEMRNYDTDGLPFLYSLTIALPVVAFLLLGVF
jgi:hypothetical protein